MAKSNSSRKFIIATASTALVAAAVAPAVGAAGFSDVQSGSIYEAPVNALVDAGVISGFPDGTFHTGESVTRAQASKMVSIIRGLDTENAPAAPFSDVKEGAWYSDYINALYGAELIDGLPGGTFGPNETLTRAQFAKMVVEAYGLEIEDANLPFTDVKAGAWYTPYIKTLYKNGLINGVTATTFAPNNNIKRGDFALLLNNTDVKFGQEADLEITEIGAIADITVDEGTEAVLPETVTVTMSDETTENVAVKWDTAKLDTNKPGTYTVTGEVEGTELTASVKVIVKEVAPAVVSVEAINATQVEIKFNKKVDATEAEKQANYTLTALDGQTVTAPQSAVLQDDEKTVIITVNNPLEKRYQFKLSTDKIESAANSAVKINYNETVTFAKDTTAPKVIGTERVSADKVKVKFSEPVYFAAGALSAEYADSTSIANADIKVGASNMDQATVAKAAATNEITLALQAGITADKDIEVTLNGVKDTADNLISPQPSKVTVVKKAADTVAPKLASVTQTGAKTFNIKFDKPTTLTPFTTDGTEVGVTGAAVTGFDRVAGTNDEYKVTVNTNLNGLQTVTVKSGKATNADGTETAADLTKLVTFVADEAAPKATSKIVTDSNNNQVIELTFDKNVNAGDVTVKGNYVKDYVTSTLDTLTVATVQPNANNDRVLYVPLASNVDLKKNLAVEGAVYNLEITSAAGEVVSDADVVMSKVTTSFTRSNDGVAPNTDVVKAADITFAQGASNDEVTVTFGSLSATRVLDAASASNVANYSIDGAVIESATLAPQSGANQVVTLKLKKSSNTFTGIRNATVKNVKLVGSSKVMESVTKVTPELNENVRPTVEKAEITANNQITLTFSEAVKGVALDLNKDSFLVKAGTATVAQATAGATIDGGNAKKVNITLNAPLTPEQLAQTITVEPTKTSANFVVQDLQGNKLESFAPVTVAKP